MGKALVLAGDGEAGAGAGSERGAEDCGAEGSSLTKSIVIIIMKKGSQK